MNRSYVGIGAILLAGAALLAGCEGQSGRAKVSGSVKVNGASVTAGTVAFHGKENVGSTQIQPDGSYLVADAPVGNCKVTVTTPLPPAGGAKPPPDLPGTKGTPTSAVSVPPVYGDVKTTTLSFDVKSGSNQFPIDIKK